MKKLLLIVGVISLAGMLNAQEGGWFSRWGLGYKPEEIETRLEGKNSIRNLTFIPGEEPSIRSKVFSKETGIPMTFRNASVSGKRAQALITHEGKRGYKKGLQDVALIGAGAAAAGYGLYRLYNWYRGDLHALAKHVATAIAAIKKGITIAKKEGVIGNDQILVSLYSAQQTLNTIDGAVKKEQEQRKQAK